MHTIGYGTYRAGGSLRPLRFERRDLGEHDVRIKIDYCGVCHSDLHQARDEWGNTMYPCLPGHEIVGTVEAIGGHVKGHKVGDRVGVGCMVDSCGECQGCQEGLEQYCEGPKGLTLTYNGPMKPDGSNTFGGYSSHIVVREAFVLRIPGSLPIERVAPILCAGVTTYSPMKHFGMKAGDKVGVVGLGGLGHMAIKIATALGANVTAITTSQQKGEEAAHLGAQAVLLSKDKHAMKEQELSFDFILSTIPEKHDVNPYICLLKRDAKLVMVGALEPLKPIDHSQVAFHRRTIAGSLIGGIAETQEVLDFCGKHNIASDVEVIAIQDINKAYDRLQRGDVKYRFVIDMRTLNDEDQRDASQVTGYNNGHPF